MYAPRPHPLPYDDEDGEVVLYRRESFSEYRDHPSKKRRDRDNMAQSELKSTPKGYKKKPQKHKTIVEVNEDDDEISDSDQSAISEAESTRSVKEITDKTCNDPTSDNENSSDARTLSEQEYKDYHDRLELVYAVLDDHLQLPEVQQKASTSLARGTVQIKPKPTTLPPAQFVSDKFVEHLDRAKKAIATVEVATEKSKKNWMMMVNPQQHK